MDFKIFKVIPWACRLQESDLPMDQLTEMFNVNHFIISQVNPHACMLASFSLSKSIWSNPFIGVVNGV